MVLAPKSHTKQYPFVDREDYIQTFIEAVNNIGQKEFSVLVYYGVGGIGKTSLRKELPKCLDENYVEYPDKKLVWASIDLQFEKRREKNTFLVSLKNELQKKYKINFPSFEIAHAIYWKKANPEIPLREENYLFFEGDNAFDDFFGVIDKIPYFSIVPATARLIKSSLTSFIKWWKTTGEAELFQLSEKEPMEIEEDLPYFWAQDLNNYLERTSKSAILFIDTYEALWEKEKGQGNFNARDEWIRELILNLPNSSLWVICGREELRWKEIDNDWNNYLEQYKLEKLPEEDALYFLNRCGIKENEVKRIILKASECVPYYLKLEVDTYTEISKTRSPKPDDFAKIHSEIFDRFMKYLNGPEQETLKVLSVPRFWNRDIFNSLIDKFKTGYSLTAFSELKRFSFVQETEGKLLLHPLMRESLQVYQDQEVKKEVHGFMCDYYTNHLNSIDIKAITPEHELALTEAFYHAKKSFEAEYLLKWFITVSDPFNRAAFWKLIALMYEEIRQVLEAKLGSEHPDVANSLNNLALLYSNMGSYEKALPLYQRALDIRENVLGPEHPSVATTLNNLALLYSNMGSYEKALPLYQRALDIRENVLGPEHPSVATTLNNLALLYENMEAYDKATQLKEKYPAFFEKTEE
jgi:tetratricopeptide (TPR) repeat protein